MLLGLLGVLPAVLGGCATAPPPPAAPEDSFVAADAGNMFRAAYGAIAERFTERADIGAIATDGLRGLADVDPALAIGRSGDRIEVSAAGRPIASLDAPGAFDSDAWGKLSVKVWREARHASPLLAAASPEDVYERIFDRAVAALDPNGRYSTAAEARRNRERRDGYTGIGVRIGTQQGETVITEVTGRGPAERAGVRVGDILTQIDGRPVAGLDTETVLGRLQDDVSGWVRLAVRRPNRGTLRFVVLKNYLIPDTVRERYEDGILYLTISHFNQGTAEDVASTLATATGELRGSLRGIVLDLRGNPGGLLQQSVKVADLFLAQGPILATRGRHPDSVQDYTAGGDDAAAGMPLAILVDGEAASAAELVAAALQDRRRAVVIGSSTYGKGTVQTVVPLPNGGELSFTWSRAVPPSGTDLRGRGVRPAVCTSGLYFADGEAIERLLTVEDGAGPAAALGCPSERRDGPVDMAVARRLLQDPPLYARVVQHGMQVAATAREAVP